ncbi:MAG: amino acid permease [Proteobacteria bacterium]|nr:amino acid permease [Pseudomonadota bacterium]
MKEANRNSAAQGRFGTFAGVFTPTVLTILGIILFLRIGWVVGQAGLAGALAIILIANVISLITGLSLSSIATNMHVRTGGTYYMIARTLGLEIGGAIGIPLYLSQAISVAFYIIGFTEAFINVFPGIDPRLLSTGIALLFGILAYVGADFALKLQFFILGALALALVSFFTGGWGQSVAPRLFAPETATAGFWQVFAIFFPAVTGIMVGVSMSGDLKDPGKSIPRGTLSAIGITGFIYLGAAVWLGTHAETQSLIADNMIMHKVARWPVLILVGVWASTLSSALGSILAAPRTLQAISTDRAVPRFLGTRLGSATEPRLAVLITSAIALVVIWMGNLDFVAPVISMFFLNTYGMINLASGLERLVGNPSFRPRFRVPALVSLAGALGCYGAMFLINATATIVAILISYGVFIVLERRSLTQGWGDIRSGFWFALTRFGLFRLEDEPWHVKNWRPNIVVFSSMIHKREELMEAGSWLSSGHGIVTFSHVLVGDIEALSRRGLRTTAARRARDFLDEHGVSAFTECSIVEDFYQGVLGIMQAHGIAGLEPNTALIGWAKETEIHHLQLDMLRRLVVLKKSVLFLRYDPERGFGRKRRIDVWWRGRDRNAELMLLLAHIISHSRPWEDSEIRVLRLMANPEGATGARDHLAQFLRSVRVEAEPLVLVRSAPDQPFNDVLAESSENSDLVLLGLPVPEPDQVEAHTARIESLLTVTGTTLLVRSGETEDILDTETGK